MSFSSFTFIIFCYLHPEFDLLICQKIHIFPHDCFSKISLLMVSFYRFGETPFKRSIESPSAWKSPWFINSFVPGPRIDTEITIEVAPSASNSSLPFFMKVISQYFIFLVRILGIL